MCDLIAVIRLAVDNDVNDDVEWRHGKLYNVIRDALTDDHPAAQRYDSVHGQLKRRPMFVGKRDEYWGRKRYGPMFVGKRQNPLFVG